eukprot:967489-Rhodomonas_salina.2
MVAGEESFCEDTRVGQLDPTDSQISDCSQSILGALSTTTASRLLVLQLVGFPLPAIALSRYHRLCTTAAQ